MVEDMVDYDIVRTAVQATAQAAVQATWAPYCELHNDQSYEESSGE
jgi:hypothetical protein